jgi:RNA polymerase sigma factor (sigma-70 family)
MKFDHSFGDFLNELGRYPLLTVDQEVLLARQVQRMIELQEQQAEGRALTPKERKELRIGMRAKEQMINCNLRMVVSIAKKYLKRVGHLTMMDLVQEGVIGLMRGVEKFDPARGYKFSTYAYWWIRQGMNRAVNQQDHTIRMPNPVAEKYPKLKATTQRLCQELGRVPSKQELADAMEMSVEQMWLMFERAATPCSLDAIYHDEGSPLIDLIPDTSTEDEDGLFFMDDRWRLDIAMAKLSEKERYVVEARHELTGKAPKSYQSLAAEIGVSRERVRQIEMKALRRLKYYMTSISPLSNSKAVANLAGHSKESLGLMGLRSRAQKNNKLQLANAGNGVA